MAEQSFRDILDQTVNQETPYFLQYEDSPPPGHIDPHAIDRGTNVDPSPNADAALDNLLNCSRPPVQWRSDLMMDFEAPGTGLAHGAASVADRNVVVASPSSASGNAEPSDPAATSFDETPARYWEDAQNEYGEVDLEAFKGAAGDVLDRILLDMMDDVVAGRLN